MEGPHAANLLQLVHSPLLGKCMLPGVTVVPQIVSRSCLFITHGLMPPFFPQHTLQLTPERHMSFRLEVKPQLQKTQIENSSARWKGERRREHSNSLSNMLQGTKTLSGSILVGGGVQSIHPTFQLWLKKPQTKPPPLPFPSCHSENSAGNERQHRHKLLKPLRFGDSLSEPLCNE